MALDCLEVERKSILTLSSTILLLTSLGFNRYFDSIVVDGSLDVTGVQQDDVIKVPQGTTEVTRIGRKIWIHSVFCKGILARVDRTTIGTSDGGIIRIMLVLDTQCNGATGAITTMLNTATPDSFRNLNNSHRYRVLYDEVVTINRMVVNPNASDTIAQGNNPVRWISIMKNFATPIVIDYDATLGAITERRSNNLIWNFIPEVDEELSLDLKMRIRFTDGPPNRRNPIPYTYQARKIPIAKGVYGKRFGSMFNPRWSRSSYINPILGIKRYYGTSGGQ